MDTKDNKYLKWYWNIIENAKNRLKPESYTEDHHIYPKSIYGEGETLALTGKEHYLVHALLWQGLRAKYGTKNEKTIKMRGAFECMNWQSKTTNQRYNSKLYGLLKEAFSERCHTEETKKKLSEIRLKYEELLKTDKNLQNKRGEFKKKMSIITSGENNGMYGKHHTEETNKIIGQKTHEWNNNLSNEARLERSEKFSIITSGENNGMYGKHHTEETNKLIAQKTSNWHKSLSADEKNEWQKRRKEKKEERKINWTENNKELIDKIIIDYTENLLSFEKISKYANITRYKFKQILNNRNIVYRNKRVKCKRSI